MLILKLKIKNDREYEEDKQSIMDIKVKTEKGERIDIEVQINDVDDYRKRSLYYWSKLCGETINKGEPYYNLKKSIVISIVDFDLIKESKKYHSCFVVKESEENYIFDDALELHYIELTKFNRLNKDIDKLNDLEEWITFLKECGNNNNEKVIEKLCDKKEAIKMATKIMEKLSADELEYQRYLAREKYWHDESSKKAYAEYQKKLAEEQAIKEGIQQGIEQGIEKGIEQGKKEGTIKVVKNAIDMGMDDNSISALTGLSIKEIEEIRKG